MTLNFTDENGYYKSDGLTRRALRPIKKSKAVKPVMTPAKRLRIKLQALHKRARGKGLEFDLDEEWIASKLALTHCEVTGIQFTGAGIDTPWSLSIDRVDNTKGYTKDNCKAVVWIYNNCKRTFEADDVMRMAIGLARGCD